MINIIEWLGTFLGLSGAFLLSYKKFNPKWIWLMWIISNSLLLSFFIIQKQYGLSFSSIIALIISCLGFYQNKNHKIPIINQKLKYLLYYLGQFVLILIPIIFFYPRGLLETKFEWISSILIISADFLIASKHPKEYLSWIYWAMSNILIFYIAITKREYGIMLLQIGFFITNINGIYHWLIKKKKPQ
jgi:nicotinamide riboside transporter PnuC